MRGGSQPPRAWWLLLISRVAVLVLVAGSLVAVGVGRAQPASATVGSLNSMTWNIQGSAGQTAWNQLRTTLSTALTRHNQDPRRPALNVVAMQEVGSRPRGATATGLSWVAGPWTIPRTPGSVNTITYPAPDPSTGAPRQFVVSEYTWDVNGTRYYIYFMPMLRSSASPAGSTAVRNGLAIISDQQATNVWIQQPQRWDNTTQSVSPSSRPAFGIRYPDGSAWWTVHSGSGPSNSTRNDASNMVTAISNRMTGAGVGNWAVLGDFNRDLIRLGVAGFGTLPVGSHIVNPVARRGPRSSRFDPQVTRPSSGTQLDYMITNDTTAGLQALTYGNYSDHLAVQFGTTLMASAQVGQISLLTQPGQCLDLDPGSGPVGPGTRLRLASCAAGSSTQQWAVNDDGTISNGGYCLDNYAWGTGDGNVIQLYTCNGASAQQWAAYANGQIYNLPTGSPIGSGKCLDTTAPSGGPPPPPGASPGMSLRTCSTSSTQLFHFQYQDPPTSGGALELGASMPGCLDHGQSRLTVQACSGGDTDQVWTLPGDGTVRVGPPGSTGQCLDNFSGNTSDGNHVQLYTCNTGEVAQQWQPRADGTLYNPASGKCLSNGAQDSSAALTIQDCYTDEPGQIWNFDAGTGTITEPPLQMCLEHNLTGNGAPARAWECIPRNSNQQWTFFGDGTVRDGSPGRCLENSGGSNTAGNPIIMDTACSGGSSQLWQLRVDGTLYNPATDKCVDDNDEPGIGNRVTLEPCASTTNWYPVGSTLQATNSGPSCLAHPANTLAVEACTPGEASQQWTLPGDGTVRVGPPGSTGQCLDNFSGNTSDGNHVQLYTCNTGEVAQQWQPRADGTLYNPASGKCLNNGAQDSSAALTIQDCYTDEIGQIWNVSGSAITQPPMPVCLNHYLPGDAVAARQWECIPGNSNYQWTQPGDGTLREGTPSNPGRCLDNYSNQSNDGNPVHLYHCVSGDTAEQWQENSDLYNPPTGKCAGEGNNRAAGAAFTLMSCVAALHWYLISPQDQ
ncbi:ricin-type beta-trefoil lectin domain protein [Kitasatospora sp. GAS204B]|uniref:ricin-type beta-trefoil lectin domain protein n=1 Tax=unclassified Kitasatospora TaxID=2633591 RepID=UPI002476819B|nr:ricin-type beta-trefoil lectin domain protein [Kitasatospora sp. GAS204B]